MNYRPSDQTPSQPVSVEVIGDRREWETFLAEARGRTLFHSLRFLDYHPQGRFEEHHVVIRRKGNIAALMPGVIRHEVAGPVWVSHPGASYGGPVWAQELRYDHLEDVIASLIDYAREAGLNAIRITPPPIIYDEEAGQMLDFALQRNRFAVIRTELTQAVPLDKPPDAMFDSFVNKTRNAFRRAEQHGLRFRLIEEPTTEEFERFYEILEENRRGLGVVPTHSREEVERLHQLIPGQLMMAVVEHKGRMIACIWNFICNDQVVLEFYMAHEAPSVQLKPVPFLTWHSLLWARERGFKWMDFGISSIWGDPTTGLLRFKENFGARHFLRQTWELRMKSEE
ncbi:MAG: GNAT family N-acetyltransferase [Calditrichaeota bacterium]|nr:GNAT family N-acetyltransferase [Calditrichota bacterium]